AKKIGLRSSGIGANPELALALKMPGMVRLAICVAYGALMRTESRGCHARDDYQARNDRDWLNRTLAYWRDLDADLPELKYEPSTKVTYLPPGDRGYGKTEIIPMDAPKED
ncbi:MAG: fumarate reductase flavoprotein subunit, partial [Proteobacteria bacterium]|nr:fumarate reductase flavoprotein subunit [Pseudomonadota bacterium]